MNVNDMDQRLEAVQKAQVRRNPLTSHFESFLSDACRNCSRTLLKIVWF
jgi:hypothetical protein